MISVKQINTVWYTNHHYDRWKQSGKNGDLVIKNTQGTQGPNYNHNDDDQWENHCIPGPEKEQKDQCSDTDRSCKKNNQLNSQSPVYFGPNIGQPYISKFNASAF